MRKHFPTNTMATPHLIVSAGRQLHDYSVEKHRQENPITYRGTSQIARLDINSYQPLGLKPIVEVSWVFPSKIFGLDSGVNATYWLLPDHGCLHVSEIGDRTGNDRELKKLFLLDFAPTLNNVAIRAKPSLTLEQLAQAAKASKLPEQIETAYQKIVRGDLY